MKRIYCKIIDVLVCLKLEETNSKLWLFLEDDTAHGVVYVNAHSSIQGPHTAGGGSPLMQGL